MEPRGRLRAGGAAGSVWAKLAMAEASALRAARAFWAAASAPVAAGATVGRMGWTWAGPCAGKVERALRRAELGVINDILDVAKSEAGKIDLNEETVDIREEIRLTARLFTEQAAVSRVNLKTDITDNLPRLNADQRKIRQILLNLVSNAVKFTPPDGSVTVSAALNDTGSIDIIVNDTGIGIKADDIAAALAPFGEVESNLSRRYEGTGLGLPLTQALVERHGGELVLESAPGRGTRVTARFPSERVLRPRVRTSRDKTA
jgi:signal transduction histidine kinase